MKKLLPILLFLVIAIGTASAQRYLGVATGNFAGTGSIYLNPANIAATKQRIVIDLFSFNIGADNNQATINGGKLFSGYFKNSGSGSQELLNFGDRRNFSLIAPSAEVRGPGAMVSIGKHTVALTTRVRAINQFHDFNERLYRTVIDAEYRNEVTGDYDIQAGAFNWTAHIWSELGLSYATTVFENDENVIRGGVTLRYLSGSAYTNLSGTNIDAHYYNSADSLRITNTAASVSSNILSTDQELSNSIGSNFFSDYFFGNHGASGFGADLGATYERRQSGSDNYLFRAGIALTDLGAIRYRKGNNTAYIRGDGYVKGSEVEENADNYSEFRSYLTSRGLEVDTSNAATKVKLPSSLIFTGDYHILGPLYAGVVWSINMNDRYKPGNSFYNQFSIVPRFDMRIGSAALPISYSALSKRLKVGLGLRLTGFFVGSDDMLALLGSKGQYGANVYLGGYVPLGKRR